MSSRGLRSTHGRCLFLLGRHDEAEQRNAAAGQSQEGTDTEFGDLCRQDIDERAANPGTRRKSRQPDDGKRDIEHLRTPHQLQRAGSDRDTDDDPQRRRDRESDLSFPAVDMHLVRLFDFRVDLLQYRFHGLGQSLESPFDLHRLGCEPRQRDRDQSDRDAEGEQSIALLIVQVTG